MQPLHQNNRQLYDIDAPKNTHKDLLLLPQLRSKCTGVEACWLQSVEDEHLQNVAHTLPLSCDLMIAGLADHQTLCTKEPRRRIAASQCSHTLCLRLC